MDASSVINDLNKALSDKLEEDRKRAAEQEDFLVRLVAVMTSLVAAVEAVR